MTKELKDLETKPEVIYKLLREMYVPSGICKYINNALTELKTIKETKPNDVMKCVERLKQTIAMAENFYDSPYEDIDTFAAAQRDVNTINQTLQRLETIDKAVDICKKANEQKFVYIKETYGIVKERFLDNLDYEVLNNRLYVNSRGMYYEFYLKEYGTFWALTKEELK